MDTLKSVLTPFAGSGMVDGMKLVVLGGTVETARRVSSSAWNHFVNSFFLTAHFSEEDYSYDWLLAWLCKQPAWGRSREFETTTRSQTVGFVSRNKGGEELEEDEDANEDDDETPGKQRMKVVFMPTLDTTHTIVYKGHFLRVKRSKKTDGSDVETLSISVVARNNSILKQLVLQAKKEYEQDAIHRVQIYFADSHGSWRWTDSRHKRPISSIVLNPGVKEMLLADTRDFLKSEKWYADRGIPFRRGYLLYGVPGSGKTSLIHAIAGELQLDIYVVSLSSSWINDSTLNTLLGRVPSRCILLLEDLDAAFTRSTSRDSASTGSPDGEAVATVPTQETSSSSRSRRKRGHDDSLSDVNTLSLSGLLNALDGVAASEGRLLFATTNHLERLDPALSRPGRMDVWIEFKNASKFQAEGLFRNFFPSADDDDESAEPAPEASNDSKDKEPTPPPASPVASTSSNPNAPTMPPAPLDSATLRRLAKQFADSIPDEEFSVAALQGYLLKNKSRPESAASEAGKWVISERELREKLRKEKEAKEKKEREEKEKRRREKEEKEKEEKEKRAKEEKEKEEAKAKAEKEAEAKAEERADAKAKAEAEAEAEKLASLPVAEKDELVDAATPAESEAGDEAEKDEITESKKEPWVAVKSES